MNGMPVFQLSDRIVFPPPHLAEADGLLAVGGDLSEKRLLNAYRQGIFPWYAEGQPVLWWSPDPRLVLYPTDLNISRSLGKVLKRNVFKVTMDVAFEDVITACADMRGKNRRETWIDREMIAAYCRLHESGFAHSVEVWQDDTLAGGLYGISLGGCFFGESMFTKVDNASKVALVRLAGHLTALDFDLIDCQVVSAHLIYFGAKEIPRQRFLDQLGRSLQKETRKGNWSFEEPVNR